MPILSKEDERYGYEPGSFAFWRNLAVYFCVFSVLGHWMEIVYCSFMNVFGIVDADSLVWDDPMYPFLVYGVGVVVCALVLMPLKTALVARRATLVSAGIQFFAVTVVVCMLMELAMGFMLNQPNAAGEYPLWDNSQLPNNNTVCALNFLITSVPVMAITNKQTNKFIHVPSIYNTILRSFPLPV